MKYSLVPFMIVFFFFQFNSCNNPAGPVNSLSSNNTLESFSVSSLCLSSSSLFAGTNGAILFLSSDNGSSWVPIDTFPARSHGTPRPPSKPVAEITVITTTDTYLFAGMGGFFVGSGMFRSTNNGRSWAEMDSGLLTTSPISSMAVVNKTIFAATIGNGIFLSTNYGGNWSVAGNQPFYDVWQLVANGANLFATTDVGIFLSVDEGKNWEAVNNGLPNFSNLYCLATIGTDLIGFTSFDGVFRSTNNGKNWTLINPSLVYRSMNVIVTSGKTIYAGTEKGVIFSTNEGMSWTNIPTGSEVDSLYVLSMVIKGSELFIGTEDRGIWRFPLWTH